MNASNNWPNQLWFFDQQHFLTKQQKLGSTSNSLFSCSLEELLESFIAPMLRENPHSLKKKSLQNAFCLEGEILFCVCVCCNQKTFFFVIQQEHYGLETSRKPLFKRNA